MKRAAFFWSCSLLAVSGAALGQRIALPQRLDSTVVLKNPASADEIKRMTSALKLAARVDVAFDANQSAFSLHGFGSNLAVAEWLIHQMDRPANWQPTPEERADIPGRQFLSAPDGLPVDDREPVTHVYYLKSSTWRDAVEIETIARIVGVTPFIDRIDRPNMLVFRGNKASVDLLEWLVPKLDVPAGGGAAQSQNPESGVYTLKNDDGTLDFVRVFYLDGATSPRTVDAMSKSIRETTKATHIFWKTSPPTIAVRGNSELMAQVQQIIASVR